HHPHADAARLPGHRGQVYTGGGDLPHRGILVLDDEIVAVAQLLGQLDLTDVLLIDVSLHRKARHFVCTESIPDSERKRGHARVSSAIAPCTCQQVLPYPALRLKPRPGQRLTWPCERGPKG